jgi:hypothetical protein
MISQTYDASLPPLVSLLSGGPPGVEQSPLDTFIRQLTHQQDLLLRAGKYGQGQPLSLMLAALHTTLGAESDPATSGADKQTLQGEASQEEREQQALYGILHTLQGLLQHLPADFSLPLVPGQTASASALDSRGGLDGESLSTNPLHSLTSREPDPTRLSKFVLTGALIGAEGADIDALDLLTGNQVTLEPERAATQGGGKGPSGSFLLALQQQLGDSLPGHPTDSPPQLGGESPPEGGQPSTGQGDLPVERNGASTAQMPTRVMDTEAASGRPGSLVSVATEGDVSLLHRGSLSATEADAKLTSHLLPRNTILLQLHPPDLGSMQVRVRLLNEHLTASFWADSPEVRALIQTHFPALQHGLSEQGFQGYQISMSLAMGAFVGHPGQFAQQHSASQPFAQPREPGLGSRQNSAFDAERSVHRPYGRHGLVDVVI